MTIYIQGERLEGMKHKQYIYFLWVVIEGLHGKLTSLNNWVILNLEIGLGLGANREWWLFIDDCLQLLISFFFIHVWAAGPSSQPRDTGEVLLLLYSWHKSAWLLNHQIVNQSGLNVSTGVGSNKPIQECSPGRTMDRQPRQTIVREDTQESGQPELSAHISVPASGCTVVSCQSYILSVNWKL